MKNRRKNKDFNPHNCGVTHFLNRVGGKWKVLVIYGISNDVNRFSSLQRMIPDINKQMLVNQLRELEEDGIIDRIIYAEVPPRVEYKLTTYGQSMMSVIEVIQKWGEKDLKNSRCDKAIGPKPIHPFPRRRGPQESLESHALSWRPPANINHTPIQRFPKERGKNRPLWLSPVEAKRRRSLPTTVLNTFLSNKALGLACEIRIGPMRS